MIGKELADPGFAAEYLTVSLADSDPRVFLSALRRVADVYGGVKRLSTKTKLNRENLYRMLSERGNPGLRSLDAVLDALGFQLAVVKKAS